MTRLTIDELEILTPEQLGKLLCTAVFIYPPDVMYIQDLIAVGCPIDVRDNNDRTALHLADLKGNRKVLEFLISVGGDINVRDNGGWTPLHYLVDCGTFDMIQFMILSGAEVNARTNRGYTATDLAILKMRDENEIRFLEAVARCEHIEQNT